MKVKVKDSEMECYFSGSLGDADGYSLNYEISDDIKKRMNTDGGVFTEAEADSLTLVTPVERREEFEDFLNTHWSDLDYYVMRLRKGSGVPINNEGYEIAEGSILDGKGNEIVEGEYTVKDGFWVYLDGKPIQ